MKLKGIILTGTSGSGKTTVANELQKASDNYAIVKAITTREKRDEDAGHYVYVSDPGFEKIKDTYFVSTEYRGKKYAITKPDINRIIDTGKLAILIISPESLEELQDRENAQFLSFFIDAADEELDNRLNLRGETQTKKEIDEQRKKDRGFADSPNYIIHNKDIKSTVGVILRLMELFEVGCFLAERDIKLMLASGMLVKGGTEKNIKGASYDLRLGDEYYYSGQIKRIEKENLYLTIEPYDYAIVSSKEEICLPKDVVAHFGLTVGLFCQGIILSNGQQVDPGFRGTLFCLLFNTSNRPVTIKRNEHYATIEFTKLNQFASQNKGKYQEKKKIIEVIPNNAMQGAINELKKEIEELKRESRNMQSIYISVISIIIAAISILMILR